MYTEKIDHIECACQNLNHIVRFGFRSIDRDYPELCFTFFLNPKQGFLKRIFLAAKYVLGIETSDYGMFEEVLLEHRQAEQIAIICHQFKAAWLNYNETVFQVKK